MIDEEHKKLVLPTVVRGIGYGVVISVLLVNVPKIFGIGFTTEVYADKLVKINEREAREADARFYPSIKDNNRCEF